MVASTSAPGSIASDTSLPTIGRDPQLKANILKEKIDEVRVFNVALRILYKEWSIRKFKTLAHKLGTIVPRYCYLSSLPFTNLLLVLPNGHLQR
jgi:hypothetical protein